MIELHMPEPWPVPPTWRRGSQEPEIVYMDGELVAMFTNRYWAAVFSSAMASIRRAELPLCAHCEQPMFPWDDFAVDLMAHMGCMIDHAVDEAKERELDRL